MLKDIIKRCIKTPVKNPKMFPVQGNGDTHYLLPPLDPESPWPKFRSNPEQTGRSEVRQVESENRPWVYQTGKGIFSSPVIDGEGTIYIGSADHYFYALNRDGSLKWKFRTNEIIDSSALLDDRGRVYFGSGDGHVYCLDKCTGAAVWVFKAHSTQEVREQFNIKTYNLNWFEGNISMLGDGTILAPNDNYLVYALDRDTGKPKGEYLNNEMGWSCPAVNPRTGRIFFGSCFAAGITMFCYDIKTGKKIWTSGGLGSVSASPLLTSFHPDGAVLFGGFDGILRAVSQKNGKQLWAFGTHDHIYGSPAQLSDGRILQASCSGTVYCLSPDTGKPVWTFDTSSPVRSSPAVDRADRIYFGSGEGRLFCIDSNGQFLWAYQCIDSQRNDLNSSPALGGDGVCIAGEDGGIFFIPYDYPLSEKGKHDSRVITKQDYTESQDGSFLYYADPFGRRHRKIPESIDANAPITLVHVLRENNATILSAIDMASLSVTVSGSQKADIRLSADRRFITLLPKEMWKGENGVLEIDIRFKVVTRLKRFGLKFFGGRKNHTHQETIKVNINQELKSEKTDVFQSMPYSVSKASDDNGDLGTVFEISRLSCPMPTMLPSYNQIGFDSLHYLAAIVDGKDNRAVLWVVPGKLDSATGKTIVNPELKDIFVLNLVYENGLLTLYNYESFKISFVGSWDMPMGLYRIAAKVDPKSGNVMTKGALNAEALCDQIRFYGKFLKLTGLSDMKTGKMQISGGLDLGLWGRKTSIPDLSGLKVDLSVTAKQAVARFNSIRLQKEDHVFGILLIQADIGTPVIMDYAGKTKVVTDTGGQVERVVLDYEPNRLSGQIRGLVMVDTHVVCRVESKV
ncbi:MAG: PQQ-binding-like beta-propeller repeat protein [Desulfobacterales bacterium]|nr:PQQ-binding-like beta-propeller repeat protein [Desulfobacterales bacterium]